MTEVAKGSQPSSPSARADVDLRGSLCSPIWVQGVRPLCVPIAISQAHEVACGGDAMGPEAIWWACSKLGRVSAEGMLMADAGSALRIAGQPLLEDWPWNGALGVGTEDPPAAAGSPPWQFAELVEFELVHDGVENNLEDALAAGFPVVLMLEVTSEFEDATAEGVIELPDIRSDPGDYHAVLIVGAATDGQLGRRLLVRNSWGEHWGAGGYGWLPVDYLVANAVQAAVVRQVKKS